MSCKGYILFFFLFFVMGCKKDPSIWEIKNLNGNKISVIGHAGMGIKYKYPMNSLESLQKCINVGANGVEMDACVTKDGVLVLCHSQNLADQTECSGLIKDKTWAELEGCRYNSPLFSKVDLIRASDFFDAIGNRSDLIFTFDCKVELEDKEEYLNSFAEVLVNHLNKYNIVSSSFIESFNTSFLEILQAKNKDLRLFLYASNYKTGLAISKDINLHGLTLDHEKISAEEIQLAHKNNLKIALFNTRTEKDNLEAVAKSPDFIQTDKVEYLINALRE